MDFSFSDEQQMLRGQARGFLADKAPVESVVAAAEGEGWLQDVWRAAAELGWIGLSAPEAAGGTGMSFLDEAVLFEEVGYALAPIPLFATVALALPALQDDSDALEPMLRGERPATLAHAEPGGPRSLADRGDLGTKAERVDGDWRLTGTKDFVSDLGPAVSLVVTARGPEGVGLWLVDAASDGVEKASVASLDPLRRAGRLELVAAPARRLVTAEDTPRVLDATRTRALVAAALESVGIAQRALDLAVSYARERHQFGKPIGTYQAVSHRIADIYVETELARSLAYWAAWAVATGDESADVAAAAAKAAAGPAAVGACERAIQVHGGIGFTWEHVLHRFYKRAHWLETFEGTAATHRARIAGHLLD